MTSSILLKKQGEQNAKLLRDLLRLPENKKCFDCPTKSPFFVNTTLQTFICTRCSGLVREVGHRVKSISASTFTGPELAALKFGGNGVAGKIWLSCGYNTADTPEPESDGDVRAFMRQKYYERKWLNRDLAVSHDQSFKQHIKELFTEEGLPRNQTRRRRGIIENSNPGRISIPLDTKEGHRLNKIPTPLDLTSTHKVQQQSIRTAPVTMTSYQPQPNSPSSISQPKDVLPLPPVIPVSAPLSPTSTLHSNGSVKQRTALTESFFSDLSGLTLCCPSPTQSAPLTTSASRDTGSPNDNITPTSKGIIKTDDGNKNGSNINQAIGAPNYYATSSDHHPSSSNHHRSTSLQNPDPYSALRAHHEQEQLRHEQMRSAISFITQPATSTKHTEQTKRHEPPTDPYAALRHMSFGPVHDSFISHPRALNHPISQSSPTLPNGPLQPHHSSQSGASNYTPLNQDNHYSKMTREWVDTQPFVSDIVDVNDDEDLMTQISSTTSQSTCSSKITPTNQPKNPSKNNDSAFGDLDPLANYKRNKITTTASSPWK